MKYNTGTDTGGDPAIYFRIVLTDAAARREILGDSAHHIKSFLIDQLYPYSRWGLIPYLTFRSESEQSDRHEPEWT